MADWGRTQLGIESRGLEDMFEDRPIIGRDKSIDGGVYLGSGAREAIVVDSKYGTLDKLYEVAKERATENGEIDKSKILTAVYETISEAMPKQDNNEVEKLITKYSVGNDKKIALDVFLQEGVGVCRHDALACAAILEKFKKEGIIRGNVSVDRNKTDEGSHAWCRYTNSAGDIYILDIAQNYFGKLEKADKYNQWDYERPEVNN